MAQLLGFPLVIWVMKKKEDISVGEIKFTGQILPIAKKVNCLLDFKHIMRELILGNCFKVSIKLDFEKNQNIRVGLFRISYSSKK